jgi:hypothetical protein
MSISLSQNYITCATGNLNINIPSENSLYLTNSNAIHCGSLFANDISVNSLSVNSLFVNSYSPSSISTGSINATSINSSGSINASGSITSGSLFANDISVNSFSVNSFSPSSISTGSINASGSISSASLSCAIISFTDSVATVGSQSAYLMWNINDYAETDFVNVVPTSGYTGGFGGFSFYNVVQYTQISSPIARIDGEGDFACNGGISCGGGIMSNGMGTAQFMSVTLAVGNPLYNVAACGLFSSPLPSLTNANKYTDIGPYIATSNGVGNGLFVYGAGGYGGSSLTLGLYYGTLVFQSSSRKYKYNIQPLESNSVYTLENFMKLEPVIFDCLFNEKETGEKSIGIIAEDVFDIGLTELVAFREGVVDGIHYTKLPIFIIKIVKEQQIKIEEQQNTINSLKSDIELLKQQITAIEAIVYKNPS